MSHQNDKNLLPRLPDSCLQQNIAAIELWRAYLTRRRQAIKESPSTSATQTLIRDRSLKRIDELLGDISGSFFEKDMQMLRNEMTRQGSDSSDVDSVLMKRICNVEKVLKIYTGESSVTISEYADKFLRNKNAQEKSIDNSISLNDSKQLFVVEVCEQKQELFASSMERDVFALADTFTQNNYGEWVLRGILHTCSGVEVPHVEIRMQYSMDIGIDMNALLCTRKGVKPFLVLGASAVALFKEYPQEGARYLVLSEDTWLHVMYHRSIEDALLSMWNGSKKNCIMCRMSSVIIVNHSKRVLRMQDLLMLNMAGLKRKRVLEPEKVKLLCVDRENMEQQPPYPPKLEENMKEENWIAMLELLDAYYGS